MRTTTCFRTGRFAASLVGAALLLALLPATGHAADSKFASLASAPLENGSGFDRVNGSPQVRHLQRQLRRLGDRPGPIDGLFGPLTEGAVRRFQTRAGLRVDGLVGPKTARHLARSMAAAHRRALTRKRISGRPKAHRSVATGARAAGGSEHSQPQVAAGDNRSALVTAALIALIATPAFAFAGALMSGRPRRTRRSVEPTPVVPVDPVPTATPAEPDWAPAASIARNTPEPAPPPVEGRRRTAVIGYVTVPEEERFAHGDEYAAQAERITEFCRRRGLHLVRIVRDVESPARRSADAPGLQHACEALARGEARALVVQRLARVTRSPAVLAVLLRWLADAERGLIVIENALDTSSAVGRLVSDALIEVGDWDSERAAQRRTFARDDADGGGRRAVRDAPELHARISAMREAGFSLHAIADRLNAEGVPTLRGGSRWRPSSVQAAVGYQTAEHGADAGLTLPQTPHRDLDEEAER